MPHSTSLLRYAAAFILLLSSFTLSAQDDCDNWDADISINFCGPNNVTAIIDISGTDMDNDTWTVWFTHDNTPILWYAAAYPGENKFYLSGFAANIHESAILNVTIATAASPNEGWCTQDYGPYSLSGLENALDYTNGVEVYETTNASCEGINDGEVKFTFDDGISPYINDFELEPEVEGAEYINWGGLPKIQNIPPGDYTVIFDWGDSPACRSGVSFVIGSNGNADLGYELLGTGNPNCTESSYAPDLNNGLMWTNVPPGFDEEDFTFEIYHQDGDSLVDIEQIQVYNSHINFYGFVSGNQCLRIFEDGVPCAQEMCAEFIPLVPDIVFEFTELPPLDYAGGSTIVELDINPPPWNSSYQDQDWVVVDDLEFPVQIEMTHGDFVTASVFQDGCDSHEYFALEYHSDFTTDIEYWDCNIPNSGSVVLSPLDSAWNLEEMTWVIEPMNENLSFQIENNQLHISNLDDAVYCVDFSIENDEDFASQTCFGLTETSEVFSIWSEAVVEVPGCGFDDSGVYRFLFQNFNSDDYPDVNVQITDLESGYSWISGNMADPPNDYYYFVDGLYGSSFELELIFGACSQTTTVDFSNVDGGDYQGYEEEVLAQDELLSTITLTAQGPETIYYAYNGESQASPATFDFPSGEVVNLEICLDDAEGDCCMTIEYQVPEFVPVFGCTNPIACNYDENADIDDGSCVLGPDCGDFNGDGVSDTMDLLIFIGAFGNIGENEICDLNADIVVNSLDLMIFLGMFGQ